jgi:hypothetical protein
MEIEERNMRDPETFKRNLQHLRETRANLGAGRPLTASPELPVERARQARNGIGRNHSRNRQHLPKP